MFLSNKVLKELFMYDFPLYFPFVKSNLYILMPNNLTGDQVYIPLSLCIFS